MPRQEWQIEYADETDTRMAPSHREEDHCATFTAWVVTAKLEVKPLRVDGPWPVEAGKGYRDFTNHRTLILHQRGVELRFGEALANRLYATEREALADAQEHGALEVERLSQQSLRHQARLAELAGLAGLAPAESKPQPKRTRRGAAPTNKA